MKKKGRPASQVADKKSRTGIPAWKPWMEVVLFTLFAAWMLVGMNSDYLFTVQERSLFLNNHVFFNEMMATPAGILHWIGCYLTQFFFYPALGASLLILVWLATYGVTLKAFRLTHAWSHLALIPVTALLCSTIDLGYWVYLIKIPGYWFFESVALLLVMLGVWLGRNLHGAWRYLWIGAWIAAGYPIMGWYALFGSLLTALIYTIEPEKKATGMQRFVPLFYTVALIGVAPLLWYYHYNQMRLEDAWIYGFPIFETKDAVSWITTAPFIVMAASCLALPFCQKWSGKMKGVLTIAMRTVVLAGCAFATWMANFDDYNYQSEMRMYRHTEEANWQKVLLEARAWKETPTRQMVILKNIALMNLGQLGYQMFHYDNGGKLPHKRDCLEIHLAHTGAELLYYQHGKLNFATRWAIENGVEYGFDVSNLKILIKCSLLSGEYNAAQKYINLLKLTTFHRDEAERLEEFCHHPEKIDQAAEFKSVKELYTHMDEDLDSDNGLCEMYLLHNFSNTMNVDSPLLQEVTLNYALISKNIQLFWPRFFQYATLHAGKEMPQHYQEAAYLYGQLEESVNINNMPFDRKKVVNRYLQFSNQVQAYMQRGLEEDQIAEIMKRNFGDTFWWFYFFCNNVGSY